jgi:NAD(P) transhydrogenase subunit alpha
MVVGVPRETAAGETRVALTPAAAAAAAAQLIKAKASVVVESGAGAAAGFEDSAYAAKGLTMATRDEVFASIENELYYAENA